MKLYPQKLRDDAKGWRVLSQLAAEAGYWDHAKILAEHALVNEEFATCLDRSIARIQSSIDKIKESRDVLEIQTQTQIVRV